MTKSVIVKSQIKELAKMESKPLSVAEEFYKALEEKNKQLPSYETIKRFAILEKDFTIEGGELTPTLKVKRKLVTERYREILDSFYNE